MAFNEFIKKASLVHQGKYAYPVQEYINTRHKIAILCHAHGVFEQKAYSHLAGHGCKQCGSDARSKANTIGFNVIVEKARIIHGDKYSYPTQAYVNTKAKMIIVCPVHGEFKQSANDHLDGCGCYQCGKASMAKTQALSFKEVIEKANSVHAGKYTYPDQDYQHTKKKMRIICPSHGEFKQTANDHLGGKGCNQCAIEDRSSNRAFSFTQMVAMANAVHNNKYTYPDQDYDSTNGRIEITCPVHGNFWQRTVNHLAGSGCQKCSNGGTSVVEKTLFNSFDVSNKINNYRIQLDGLQAQVKKPSGNNVRSVELDIFFPDKNVAVEFHGLYWHSESRVGKTYHADKLAVCQELGIDLIQIFEDEWKDKPEIVKSIINTRLGIYENRYMARKTTRIEVDSKTASDFYEVNHIQGKVGAAKHYGLMLKGDIVAMASFGVRSNLFKNNNDIELIRFCTKLNTQVIGGLSKLMKPFKGQVVKTYCDLRLFNGNGYQSSGFNVTGTSKPGYYYVKSDIRYSRFQFQKHKLAKVLDSFNSELSEPENMKNNGYSRIFDCGTLILCR